MTILSQIEQQRRETDANPFWWLDCEVEFIRREAEAGNTALNIAHALGRSRSAVLGKMHRENITINRPNKHDATVNRSFKPHGVMPSKASRKPLKVPAKPVQPSCQTANVYDAAALNITLDNLGKNQCRWAVNDGGPFLFCGHEVEPGKPYCEHHGQRARKRDA